VGDGALHPLTVEDDVDGLVVEGEQPQDVRPVSSAATKE
jgi:hypothetical protein